MFSSKGVAILLIKVLYELPSIAGKKSSLTCGNYLYGIFKAAYSVTMNIFRKKKILLKSFVKVELSYVATINLISTAENCMEK